MPLETDRNINIQHMLEQLEVTNWNVITGPPSSGKTSVANNIAFYHLDYVVIPEAARIVIDQAVSEGRNPRADERSFLEEIFKIKVDVENRVPFSQKTFFDRGIPDVLAYWEMMGEGDKHRSKIFKAMTKRYRNVFLLDPLPVINDYARPENNEFALELHQRLYNVYDSLMYDIIHVPVMSVMDRAEFIINKL